MQYLVEANRGPLPASPTEAIQVLEGIVIPHFEHVMKLERDKVIIGGGLPVGRPSVRHDHRGGRQRRGRPHRTRDAGLARSGMEGHTLAECRVPRRYGTQGHRNAQEPEALDLPTLTHREAAHACLFIQ